jgi:hypothetical protein
VGTLFVKAIVIGSVLAALGLAIAAGDRETFVPPPDSVAESFVRHLAGGRYDRARALLSRHAAASADLATLETLARDLERSAEGGVARVDAAPLDMKANIAEAAATVRDAAGGQRTVTFALVRENGLWRIDGWTR